MEMPEEDPPEQPRKQPRRPKQRKDRSRDRFELEDGGPPHPERSDDAAHCIPDGVLEYGGPVQSKADINAIPPPVKVTLGKWIKFHGPAAAIIPILALVGVVASATCFIKAGVVAGVALSVLSIILTSVLAFNEARRSSSRSRQ